MKQQAHSASAEIFNSINQVIRVGACESKKYRSQVSIQYRNMQ
ncbi:hypothetical protein QWZ13_07460 [Reinekea marina]|nr:hypothetical protein [Reinekea marina]MDN3647994.1 hypothetical protein [Reinekea marina]MDN3648751.1 hypothetical protein [Reinekea marina]